MTRLLVILGLLIASLVGPQRNASSAIGADCGPPVAVTGENAARGAMNPRDLADVACPCCAPAADDCCCSPADPGPPPQRAPAPARPGLLDLTFITTPASTPMLLPQVEPARFADRSFRVAHRVAGPVQARLCIWRT